MNEPPTTQHPVAAPKGSEFHVGDRVTWTHCRSNGRSIQFSTRTGKIVLCRHRDAFCKQDRNGRTEWVLYGRMRRAGQRTELTDIVTDFARSPNAPRSAT